jgi:hypothetical protein
MCIKVPKKQTQRSPKNRTSLYELYVHGKSDQDIEVPYGPIKGSLVACLVKSIVDCAT